MLLKDKEGSAEEREGSYQRKAKGQQLKCKIVSAPFPNFFALFHTFHTSQKFSPRTVLKIKAFFKENKNKKTKPFFTLVVARLSSSDLKKRGKALKKGCSSKANRGWAAS